MCYHTFSSSSKRAEFVAGLAGPWLPGPAERSRPGSRLSIRHGLRLALPSIIAFGKGCAERVNPRAADGCDLADTPERLKELLQKLEAGQLSVVERVKILRAAARRRGFRRRSTGAAGCGPEPRAGRGWAKFPARLIPRTGTDSTPVRISLQSRAHQKLHAVTGGEVTQRDLGTAARPDRPARGALAGDRDAAWPDLGRPQATAPRRIRLMPVARSRRPGRIVEPVEGF